jgi:hypothetical protein
MRAGDRVYPLSCHTCGELCGWITQLPRGAIYCPKHFQPHDVDRVHANVAGEGWWLELAGDQGHPSPGPVCNCGHGKYQHELAGQRCDECNCAEWQVAEAKPNVHPGKIP